MEILDYIESKIKDMPSLSRQYTSPSGYSLKNRYAFYRLKKYVTRFLEGNATEQERWLIIYGLRGIGKTTVLFQMYEFLRSNKVPPQNMIYLPADEIVAYLGADLARVLDVYFEKKLGTTLPSLITPTFIFIDEAHYDSKWAAVVKAIHDSSKKVFVFVTGSSAIALDINTDAERRSTKVPMFPLGFWEYEILKNNLYPPKGATSNIKDMLVSGEDGSVPTINGIEIQMAETFSKGMLNVDQEVMNYLSYGGFGFGLTAKTPQDIYQTTNGIIDRVIKSDLATIRSFNSETQHYAYRILGYLALKKPGETSHIKLANHLDVSPTIVNSLLTSLEKTHLIFSIKPYTKSSKEATNLPWKYYFLTTTLLTAIRHNLGVNLVDTQTKAMLWESAVAANLFRLKFTGSTPISLFYDAEKEGCVDFLMVNEFTDKLIPVEVGLNKDESQIKKAIETYESEFGVVVSGINQTIKETNVIKIPFRTFLS